MKLIEISHIVKTKTGPFIMFYLKGNIRLSFNFVDLLCPEAFDSIKQYYLHFYQEEENLFVKMDTDPKEGIAVRFDGSQNGRRNSSNISCSAKATLEYFTGLFDWPLAADKKHVIKYKVGEEVEKGIFQLI